MMSTSLPARRRRRAIVALILVVPVGLWAAWDYREARRLQQFVLDLQHRGEPITTTVHPVPTLPAEQNASRYYQAAADLVFTTTIFGRTDLAAALLPGSSVRDRALETLRTWLDKHREAESLLQRATGLAFGGTEYGSIRSADPIIRLTVLANARRLERLEAGDADGAAAALVAQIKVSRFAAPGEPLSQFTLERVVSGVRDLPRVLALSPSAGSLASLSAALEELDRDDLVERTALRQRAAALEDYWDAGGSWYRAVRGGPSFDWTQSVVVRPLMANRVVRHLALLTDLVERSRQPWPARLEVEAPETMPALVPWHRALTDVRIAGVLRFLYRDTSRSLAASLAELRAAREVVALESYRQRNGSFPEALDVLVPTVLNTSLVDPFSGRPLLYRKTADGYAVYSVGPDGEDGGGATQRPERKRGERTWPADIGFRVASARGDSTLR